MDFYATIRFRWIKEGFRMRMTIGERLKERSKELHMTLEDVSKATGMPKSTIQRWESGAVINMGLSNL